MEYNYIAVLQKLLGYAFIGMLAVQCVHPAGQVAVAELCQRHAIVGNRFYIITAGVAPGHTHFGQRLLKYIDNSRIQINFHCLASNPGLQISIFQRVGIFITGWRAVYAIAHKSEIYPNLIRIYTRISRILLRLFQHRNLKFYGQAVIFHR